MAWFNTNLCFGSSLLRRERTALNLALLTLSSILQHGRNAAQQATLIVITDGRGNVPLHASHKKLFPFPHHFYIFIQQIISG